MKIDPVKWNNLIDSIKIIKVEILPSDNYFDKYIRGVFLFKDYRKVFQCVLDPYKNTEEQLSTITDMLISDLYKQTYGE